MFCGGQQCWYLLEFLLRANDLQGAKGYFYLTQRWTSPWKAKLLLTGKMVLYQIAFAM